MPGIQDLRNAVVVITGAGSGIGHASARAFAKAGARLALCDINESTLTETAELLERGGTPALRRVVDVSDREQVAAFASYVQGEWGAPDVLFNNAGVGVSAEIKDMPLDAWEWLVNINYWGVVYGIHYFLPGMLTRGRGHIVNTASMAGLAIAPSLGAYASTKHALVGLGLTMRLELRPHNIGVSTICPGMIDTGIVDATRYVSENSNADKVKAMFRARAWPPEHVAEAVVRAVQRDIPILPVGREAWAAWYAMRVSPRLADWVISALARRMGI